MRKEACDATEAVEAEELRRRGGAALLLLPLAVALSVLVRLAAFVSAVGSCRRPCAPKEPRAKLGQIERPVAVCVRLGEERLSRKGGELRAGGRGGAECGGALTREGARTSAGLTGTRRRRRIITGLAAAAASVAEGGSPAAAACAAARSAAPGSMWNCTR